MSGLVAGGLAVETPEAVIAVVAGEVLSL